MSTESGSPGTSSPGADFVRMRAFGARNITGFGSAIAESMSPYASRGVEGITIFQPGIRVACPSNECEW